MMRHATLLLVVGVLSIQAKAPTEGLVGHWKLDEEKGETVADASGKGNAGTRLGGPRSSAEVPKDFINPRCLEFDGKDDRINAGDAALLSVKSAFTLAAWVRPTANSDLGGIIVNKEGEYEIGRASDGKLQFALANEDPGWNFVETGFEVPLNAWTHIAWSYSAAAKKLVVYANGREVFSLSGEGELGDNYPDLNQLWIGGRSKEDGVEYFAGQIAEVRLYDRALKPEEVGAIHSASMRK